MSSAPEDADLELQPTATRGLAGKPTASESAVNATGTSSTATDVDADGITALHWAAINNRITICKYLLDNGAEVDAKGGSLQATPLHWAARRGWVYIVHLLVQYGADVHGTDLQGFNTLLLSVHSSNILLVIYLLHLEVPVDTADPNGRTALHWAAYQGDALTVDLLLNWGADVKLKDATGFTALHWAVVRGNKSCMKRLIEEGSDINAVSNEGKSCQTMAQEMNTIANWNAALKEAGRLPSGEPRIRTLSVRNAKLILFFVPYVLLFAIFNIGATYPFYISIPLSIALFLATLKTIGRFVLPNITTAPHAMIQTPFYSGVFSGTAFWVLVHYFFNILPATIVSEFFTNLAFCVVFGIVVFCFFSAMFMDPGVIPRLSGVSEQRRVIEELIERGEYDTRHFCISTYIRKPLRSKYDRFLKRVVAKYDHYCPWINNVVGVRNHRRFIIFVVGLVFGIPLYLSLFAEYTEHLPGPEGSTCDGTFEDLCHASEVDSYGVILGGWVSLQMIWVVFLAFVQLVQVSRAITTNEASNLHKYGFMGADDFSSLPPDHASNPNNTDTAHAHNHAKRRWWTPVFKLLGIDQFISTAQDTMASRQIRQQWRATNPADHGYYRNCVDFWFPQGDVNILKALPEGTAAMGDVTVNYYTLWDFPSKKNQDYELVENIV
ncbi:hypothetical protein DV113_004011 [Geotrichum candidum]|nr:hypothetical protein DV113_004011 [Geotrichum candidum]